MVQKVLVMGINIKQWHASTRIVYGKGQYISNTNNLFNFIIYADDTTLSATIEVILNNINNDDVKSKINSEIACINDWLKCNKLSLNISKCKYMIFHMPKKKNEPFTPKCSKYSYQSCQ